MQQLRRLQLIVCMPPSINYPALCAALAAWTCATIYSGNSLAAAAFFIGEAILEATVG